MELQLAPSLAQGLAVALIVGPLLAWLKMKAKREKQTKSLQRFTIKTPQTYLLVFLFGAFALEALMVFVYAYNGLSHGDWSAEFLWLGHAFALVLLAIWLVAVLQKLEVDGDALRYRTILGRTRRASFSAIDKVTLSNQGMLVSMYAHGRRFASLSGDATCMSNLFARCEKEGVPVTAKEGRPLTLWSLYRSSITVFAGIGAGVSAAITVVIIVMVVSQTEPPTLLLAIPALWLGLPLLIVSMCSVLPLRGISQIKRQEQLLGFSFAQEMAARNARGAGYLDGTWFVAVSNCNIVAFHRDYLARVGASKKTESGDESIVVAVDDTKHKVRAAASTLKRLRTWFDEEAPTS